jgi:hypothetical protein
MDLDAGAVDEQPVGHLVATCQRREDALPDASLGPAHEAVVERFLGTIDMFRAVSPAPAALERMDNAREHATIINPRHPTRIARQKWLDPRPLRIRKPKEISHPPCLLIEGR